MTNVDNFLKTALDISLSIVVRRTALRKIRMAKKSVELTNAVIKLIKDMEDPSLQRECLKIAGDMAIYQASDVIFPVTQGKGMNTRYAIQALGRIGGTKAYHYLLNIDKDQGVNSYEAKRAMREIERKEPNIKELIKDELEQVQESIEELKRNAIEILENAKKDPVSDPMNLKSDPIDIISDSDFDLPTSQDMEEIIRRNRQLEIELNSVRENFIASESLRSEQEKLYKEEHALNEKLQNSLEETQTIIEKQSEQESSKLEAKIASLQRDLDQTNDLFLKERKRWVEEKEELNRQKIELSAQKVSPKEESEQVNALQKRIEGQQLIINKLQDELEKKLYTKKGKIKTFKKEDEKNNSIGCIIGIIIAFFFFMTCR